MSSSAGTYPSANVFVRPTTIIESTRLDAHLAHLGVKIVLASEAFQHTGSFKFRAAYHVAINVPQKLLITASSGAGICLRTHRKILHCGDAFHVFANQDRRGARIRRPG
jgi:hypothetical protein